MNLSDIAAILGLSGIKPLDISGFSIDSRSIQKGDVFVALKGESFDGHDYMEEAARKGAVAILCELAKNDVQLPQLVVPNALNALTVLATAHRHCMSGPVIALTGSNGKTTVKEMIASILPQPAHATCGNFNNHIGVPLSVLQLKSTHRYAVFELGANHIGEIAHTVAVVKPQIALINNIAPAHVEGFGSVDKVASAKAEIYQGLAKDGIAIVNADDAYAPFFDEIVKDRRVLKFSAHTTADIHATDISADHSGCMHFTLVSDKGAMNIALKVPGKHQVNNALAAASCCLAADIALTDIKKGLESFTGVAGRMTRLEGKKKSVVIDDTYNANLRSVLTALDVLGQCTGKKIFIFGDMGELGEWTVEHHQEVGLAARNCGIDQLITCGKHSQLAAESFGINARHYTSQEGVADDLLPDLDANTTILVKGSRSSAMEKIVYQLLN